MSINDIITKIQNSQQELGITLYPGASDKKIAEAEVAIQLTFPEDIKQFYKFCNGFESDQDLFRIIPLEELISNEKNKDILSNQFYIAEYMDYCDMWAVEIGKQQNEYTIINEAEGEIITLRN
jgi:cell wall assembly regulator SMI1